MRDAAPWRRILWLALGLCLATSAAAQTERRLALVIGNGAYRDAPLKNPVGDARAMAGALRQAGFAVTQIENANRLAMQRAILAFGRALDREAIGLFYYAGHGMQVRGTNYLIPVGAEVRSEDEVEVEAVDVNYALARMATASNRLNLVILDACRDNPFARSFRSAGRGLAAITAPSGTLIAYATAPGSTAADGEGANGLYTEALMEAMRQPGLRVEDVFKRARTAVLQRSDGRQIPWESSSLTGDFYFHTPRRIAAPRPPPLPQTPQAGFIPPSQALPRPPPPAEAAVGSGMDCPLPGLMLRSSLGLALTAIEPQGQFCRWQDASGAEYHSVGPFLPLSFQHNRSAVGAMRSLQLARAGAEASATEDDGSAGTFTWSWRVVSRGPVTVKAGDFDAILVEAVREGERGAHRSVRRYWYVPALRVVVKYQAVAERGVMHDDNRDWEAVEVRAPAR